MLCFPDDCGTKKKAPYRHVQTGGLHLLKGENLLGLDDLAVLVDTAIGAYAMRKLDLAALRANGTRRCIHAVVSAAARMSTDTAHALFRYCHFKSPSSKAVTVDDLVA